jgi:uncharacterized RDD family membrane protein YckC
MKCPKCEYLGFESSERCRNCGYDFSLAPSVPAPLDLTIDHTELRPEVDLDRIIGAPSSAAMADLPLFGGHPDDAAPLIAAPSRPRAPLGVRRATPEVPRARIQTPRPAEDTLFEAPPIVMMGAAAGAMGLAAQSGDVPATPWSRVLAALLDVSLLSALDAAVLYFTLRLCGLASWEILQLPAIPLAAFFLLLNGGYFVAFTAVGGQSIGKMALGIKVITQEDSSVPIGQATLRTLAYLVSALPLGAGFLPGILSADRRALHDRLAHTRVVRPPST